MLCCAELSCATAASFSSLLGSTGPPRTAYPSSPGPAAPSTCTQPLLFSAEDYCVRRSLRHPHAVLHVNATAIYDLRSARSCCCCGMLLLARCCCCCGVLLWRAAAGTLLLLLWRSQAKHTRWTGVKTCKQSVAGKGGTGSKRTGASP